MKQSGSSLIAAALILGACMLTSALLVRSSIQEATRELGEVLAMVRPAQPPAEGQARRRGRLDPGKRYAVDLKGAPVRGARDAAVTVVEFSDFECPYCARVSPTLAKIEETYGDQVRIAFKHMPLSVHRRAPAAHAAAEAAHQQGRFWEMHDRIFADQRGMSPQRYEAYALELGLDVERFRRDVVAASTRRRVDADAAEAARLGITGTPAFFINGRHLSGAKPFETFQRIIEEELRRARG